ncbi:Na+/H+ antiporter subunit E [Oerskovia flava]|uniref:Na+/H+ antiporter subunit E n=1 Tax=Oerskovia flava TaxID=2986422 RepID=UPI002240755D|nr:Na+/H+ antiporter subunit E [Oerskovia sp. JB1-3-2]
MSWLTWPLRWAWFVVWFVWQVVVSNFTVIRDTVTPGQNSSPCIARLETRCRSAAEVTLLATAITLTPGTLTLGTRTRPGSSDGAWDLYVHGMYADGPEGLIAELRVIEDHMVRATRRKETAS